MENIEKIFRAAGGEFISPPSLIQEKLQTTRAFIFDWDGVFNAGVKGERASSLFAEADSMGINMLRFGWYRSTGVIPPAIIITGESNESALHLARREHFQAVYFNFRNKVDALHHVCEQIHFQPDSCAFFFDDVADLSLARLCGLQCLIRRKGGPLFERLVASSGWCDYITGRSGDENGVRECCELMLGLTGRYEATITERVDFSAQYQDYLTQRNSLETQICTWEDGRVVSR